MTVFRVYFGGDDLSASSEALAKDEVVWEGTERGPSGPARHRALVEAESEHEATASVREAVASRGNFSNFSASLVTNARGEPWDGAVKKNWHEIDWEATPELAKVSQLERGILFALAEMGLPARDVVADADVPTTDRSEVESALEELERRRLVYSAVEYIGHPVNAPGRWWAITDEGWDLLGLIKSPRYR